MAANKHVCPVKNCQKVFSKPSRLTIHIRTHTGERPFVCQYESCMKQYTRQQHLKRHEEVSHSTSSVKIEESREHKFRCTTDGCDNSFLSKHSLNRHIHRVHSKDIYKCPAIGCEETFKKHQQLKTHYAIHQEELPYKCSECERRFPFPNKLKRHLKIHEGYKCEQEGCEARFDKWTLLVKHRKVHHQTVHTCPTCGKSFRQKQWLKEHSKTHSEERVVFECPHDKCQREYLSQRNLNAHIRSYHDNKRFMCEEPGCGRTFATKQKQQQHLKMHDPNRPVVKIKKKKKSLAEKLTGVQNIETETRGESVDDVMMPVDLDPDLELGDLHLNSKYHDNCSVESAIDERAKTVVEKTTNMSLESAGKDSESAHKDSENDNTTSFNNKNCDNNRCLHVTSISSHAPENTGKSCNAFRNNETGNCNAQLNVKSKTRTETLEVDDEATCEISCKGTSEGGDEINVKNSCKDTFKMNESREAVKQLIEVRV